jgi:hypothetical protein
MYLTTRLKGRFHHKKASHALIKVCGHLPRAGTYNTRAIRFFKFNIISFALKDHNILNKSVNSKKKSTWKGKNKPQLKVFFFTLRAFK